MKKHMMCLLLSLLLALNGLLVPALAEEGRTFESARQSVVRIYTSSSYTKDVQIETGDIQRYLVEESATGSGFAVGRDDESVQFIVTNRHVVLDGSGNICEDILVVLDTLSRAIPASVDYISDRTDLAILRMSVPTSERVPAVLRAFDSMGSEQVYTLGFPGAADAVIVDTVLQSTIDHITLRQGIVSRVLENAETWSGQYVQHDAVINGGNSGGPLVDANGYVVGVNTLGLLDQNGVEQAGLYYSVSSNEVIRMLEDERIPFMTVDDLATPTPEPTAEPTLEPTLQPTAEPTAEPTPVPALNGFINAVGGPWVLAIIAALVVVIAVVAARLLSKKGSGNSRASSEKAAGSAQYQVVIEAGALAGQQFELRRKTVVGRDPEKCQIVYPNKTPNVSAVHCALQITEQGVTITDEHSTRGTFVDGKRIAPGVAVRLHRGQKVALGSDAQVFTLRSR